MEEQDHQSLAFLSGEFKGAQLRWTVPEKEGLAIVDTVTKLDNPLLSHDEFSILSDHLNLTSIYNPLSADPTLARKCCTQAATLGTQDVRVLVPHGSRDGQAKLLNRPDDKMRSRLDSRQREQSAWQDGQPLCTAVHQPARLRYGGVFVEEGILLMHHSAVNEYERASKAPRRLVKKYLRSKSMMAA
jgi:hypothetical protein